MAIDRAFLAVVRRLLEEAYEKDRNSFSRVVLTMSRIWLRNDPRRSIRDFDEQAYDIGSWIAAGVTRPVVDSTGRTSVPLLHSLLIYRTQRLGAPDIYRTLRSTADGGLLTQSRKFLLELSDLDLNIAIRSGLGTEIGQFAYRTLASPHWLRTKSNLRNLILRTPQLTWVRADGRRFVGHSRFFRGAPQACADELGRLPGRVLSSGEVKRLVGQSPLGTESFAWALANSLDEPELVLINVDALTTARAGFEEAVAPFEAPWVQPRTSSIITVHGVPISLALERLDRTINEVVAEIGRTYHPRRLARTEERMDVWGSAAAARLKDYFGIHYLWPGPADWREILATGLDHLEVKRNRTSHRRVVDQIYRRAKARLAVRFDAGLG